MTLSPMPSKVELMQSKVAFMILGILILANLAMTTRLPTRHRGTATVHADQTDVVTTVRPDDIPKINYRTFFDPPYIVTVVGAALCMMGVSLPVSPSNP